MGYISILITTFMWSILNILNKFLVAKYELNPLFLLFVRSLFGITFILGLIYIFHIHIINWYAFFIGINTALILLSFFQSFKYINVGLSSLILNTGFIFGILFSYSILDENINIYQSIIILFIILFILAYGYSKYIIKNKNNSNSINTKEYLGIIFSVLSALLVGVNYTLFNYFSTNITNPLSNSIAIVLGLIFLLLIIKILTFKGSLYGFYKKEIYKTEKKTYLIIAIMGGGSVIADLGLFYAFSQLSGVIVNTLTLVSVPLTYLWAYLLLKEKINKDEQFFSIVILLLLLIFILI